MNIALGQFLGALVEVFKFHRFELLFIRISELIFVLPFAMGGLIFSFIILFILARSFGGRGSFLQTFSTGALFSTPLIGIFIPSLQLLASAYYVLLLLIAFPVIHRYPFHKALVTIAIPTLVLILGTIILGLFPKI